MKLANAMQEVLRVFFVAGFIGLGSAGGTARAADEMEVKIGYYPGAIFHLPLHVAEAKGFYKQAGLKATLITVPNGPLMNSLTGSGAIDFGHLSPSNVGLARQQGLDQVFIVGNVTMPWVLIARKDLKVPNKGKYPEVLRDLKGLKWGVYGRGSDGEVFMRVMAGDAKLDVDKDMAWIAVGGPPTGLPALRAGQIDVYLTLEPAPTVAEALGFGTKIIDLRKGEGPGDFKGILWNSISTLRKTAQSKPKAVAAIVEATIKAQCWLRKPENFNELLTIARTRTPSAELSEKQFSDMVGENISTFTPTMPASHFKIWNEMMLRANVLKDVLPADSTLWKSIPEKEPVC